MLRWEVSTVGPLTDVCDWIDSKRALAAIKSSLNFCARLRITGRKLVTPGYSTRIAFCASIFTTLVSIFRGLRVRVALEVFMKDLSVTSRVSL